MEGKKLYPIIMTLVDVKRRLLKKECNFDAETAFEYSDRLDDAVTILMKLQTLLEKSKHEKNIEQEKVCKRRYWKEENRETE